MQATEKKSINRIWLAAISVIAVAALILGIVALVNHGDTKSNAIPTINQQVDNIKNTLPELEAVSTELKGYIDTLETTTEKLQSDLTAVGTAIDTLKKELGDDIDENEQAMLDKLTELKTTIEGQIATITTSLQTLAKNDEQLGKNITDLKTYVDTGLQGNKDWATATFSTLEQYEATQTTISEIKALIATINTDIDTIEKDVAQKVDAINKSIADLDAELADEVKKVTDGYTAAIANASNTITAAYTDAIKTAITNSETSMKEWVNGVLAEGYYTKAEIDAKITALQTQVTESDAELQKDINDLETALAKAESELTAAYEKAIEDAITENNGKISAEIAAAVTTAQDNLQAQIDAINSEIEKIKARLDIVEADIDSINQQIDTINGSIDDLKTLIAELEASDDASEDQIEALKDLVNELQAKLDAANNRIQSITFIPGSYDGKVLMDYTARTTSLDFRIAPASLAKQITAANVKAYAHYTGDPVDRDGATDAIPLTVSSVTGEESGMLTVNIAESSDSPFSNDFWQGNVEAVIYIVITDANGNDLVSEAIPMIAHNYAGVTFNVNPFEDGGTHVGEAGN